MQIESQELLSDRAGYKEPLVSSRCDLAIETLASRKNLRIRVNGHSMMPAIWPGDVLQVESSEGKVAAIGELVLFKRYERLFAHRVVRRGAGWLVTRGDAVPGCDPPIAESEVLGVVTGIIRGRDFDANDGAGFQ